MEMKILNILLVMITIVSLAACRSSDSNTNPLESMTTELEITDKFDQIADTFVVGDDVVITAAIKNLSSVEKTIEFTAPLITIRIYSEDGTTLIFDPDIEISFPQVLIEIVIASFSKRERSLTWKGIDNTVAQVAPGTYQVRVEFDLDEFRVVQRVIQLL